MSASDSSPGETSTRLVALEAARGAAALVVLIHHFELAFAPLARRLGWRPEFPWARLVNWAAKHGGVTLAERRPMPPMGHFSLIRYRKS